jgi:Type VI secretion system spike protein VgrG3-like, C-terminal
MRYLGALALIQLILAAARADNAPLGKLSEKYESGSRGPATVSTGVGDPGGVSYGTYQLASKIGRADEFVRKYYPEEFKGLKGGTPEFTKKWKELAASDPGGLHKKEHEFIRDTHYDPQVRKLKKDLNLDVDKRSAALRDVLWSTAVQHGPNSNVIVQAAKPLLDCGKSWSDISDEALIRAVYAERGRKTADGKLVHFPGVSAEWIPALSKRFENELKDALKMLAP